MVWKDLSKHFSYRTEKVLKMSGPMFKVDGSPIRSVLENNETLKIFIF